MTTAPPLPSQLYRAMDVRALDDCAINTAGIAGKVLMERAGQAAFAIIQRRWPAARRILVCCGGGNNGGDGYVVASLARRAGRDVTVLHLGDRDALRGDARAAMQQAAAASINFLPWAGGPLPAADLVVDALLGTGFSGAMRADCAALVDAVNAAGLPVLALDIPSGLCADTGTTRGAAIRADATVTFIGLKQGLFTARGPALCGEVHFDDLRVPSSVYAQVPPAAQRLDATTLRGLLPPRRRDAHKGDFGHVLVVGGDHGYGGAALLAATAAARSGAGLVSVATCAAHVPACIAACPELMAHAVEDAAALAPLLARARVVVAGPGLGRSAWARELLAAVLASGLPLLLDADALNLLADGSCRLPAAGVRVLTPHPGEAARLLGCDTTTVQQDRFAAVQALQQRYGGAVLLKGAGTLIADGHTLAVAAVGNPGMASGGMGDVLSGIIGGLLAPGRGAGDAARLGAVLHGSAADLAAAAQGERGLLAGDLLAPLRTLLNARGDDAT